MLGDGHPDTLKSCGNLAALLVEMAHYPARSDGSASSKKRAEERRAKQLEEALTLTLTLS